MPSTTLISNEPLPQTADHEEPALSDDAQQALSWLARTARWQRRLDQLRAAAS